MKTATQTQKPRKRNAQTTSGRKPKESLWDRIQRMGQQIIYADQELTNSPCNSDTMAAIEEARSGVEMEELSHYDIEHFEEWAAKL